MVRVLKKFQSLNALLKSQSGGLGNFLAVFDKMDESTCFTCLDLASVFFQIKIYEAGRDFTVFHDAEGKLEEYLHRRFRLKIIRSVFVKYVRGCLMPMKRSGVRNWLNDIPVPSHTVAKY